MTITELLRGIEGITGKEVQGRIIVGGFYSESIVRELYKQFIALPLADQSGFFELEEGGNTQRYGTKNSWSKECV